MLGFFFSVGSDRAAHSYEAGFSFIYSIFHFHESSCSLRFHWLTIAQSCLLPTGYSLLIVKLASVTRDEGTRSSYEFLTRFTALFSSHRLSK